MAARQSRGGTASSGGSGSTPAAVAGSVRQNEYFVPRDGIDREVITADICRYLGNDALVRPGHYENPQTGQAVQGYYITAYRNLTTAMIEDLKADSARWDQERRQQSARNTPGAQYRFSETHSARQQQGPTDTAATYQTDPYSSRDTYDNTPRYSGSGAQSYASGSAAGYGAQPQTSYGGQNAGGYGQYSANTSSYSPQPDPRNDPRYAGAGAHISSQGYGMEQAAPYVSTGANLPRGYTDPYAAGTTATQRTPTSMSMSTQQAQAYMTSGQQQQSGYSSSGYYQPQVPSTGYSSAVPPQSQDPVYGRASPAGTTAHPGFPATQGQQQYEETSPRTAAPPTNAQMPSSATTHTRRGERDSNDRHHGADRHHRPPRR